MHIQEDLDTMFAGETMPLGHRRKIETAVKNLKSAIDTGSHEHHLPIVEEKVQNVYVFPFSHKMSMRSMVLYHSEIGLCYHQPCGPKYDILSRSGF
jgi:hypothetical protein